MEKHIAATAELTRRGWLHIRLDTLLPHCRYGSVRAVEEAVSGSLDSIGGKLPFYEEVVLFIDEHSNGQNRSVFDQDNKAWKAIPNALKGWVFVDDDQYTLGICLLSKRSVENATHIWVVPRKEGFRYLRRREKRPFELSPLFYFRALLARLQRG